MNVEQVLSLLLIVSPCILSVLISYRLRNKDSLIPFSSLCIGILIVSYCEYYKGKDNIHAHADFGLLNWAFYILVFSVPNIFLYFIFKIKNKEIDNE